MIINIVPTEICKWNCCYCIFPSIKNPKSTTVEIIDKHCTYIKNILNILKETKINIQVCLQGGEVGELSKDMMTYLLDKFDTSVVISTNGLFLEKEYHKDSYIRKYIDQIHWHVSPDCKLEIIKDVKDDIKIIRGVVCHNQQQMDNFILYNKDSLNIEYSKTDNLLHQQSYISTDIIEKCRNYHNEITIDLVNENLCLCIRNFKDVTIPLNEINLISLLRSFPLNTYNLPNIEKTSCYSCCRLCVDRINHNMFKERLKTLKVISA